MDLIFGIMAATVVLVFYALHKRTYGVMLTVVAAASAGSVYCFAEGAWPMGAIEAVWATMVARRWWSLWSPFTRRSSG